MPPSHPALRNKSAVIGALAETGMLGFVTPITEGRGRLFDGRVRTRSPAPQNASAPPLGIGATVPDQPDSVVEDAHRPLTQRIDYGEGRRRPGFRDAARCSATTAITGRARPCRRRVDAECDAIMGGNWARFFADSFGPQGGGAA